MSQDIQTLLPELKRLASMATPGPWTWWTSCSFRRLSAKGDGDVLHGSVQSDGRPDISFQNGGYTGPDAAYIAAANPATLLALIAHIEALERQLAELRQAERQAPEWISVEDRLPECRHECTSSGTDVSDTVQLFGTCVAGYKGQGVGHLRDDGKWICYEGEHDFMIVTEVTHWMPLPAAPSAGQATLGDGGQRQSVP